MVGLVDIRLDNQQHHPLDTHHRTTPRHTMPWDNSPAKRQRDSATYDTEWRRKRLACLRAANWRCEIRLEGCQGAASQADHIDQAVNDPSHSRLRAACESCHRKVTASQGGGYRRPPNPAPRPPRTTW